MSDEALQIAEKRREAKGKGIRERYTCLCTEFQRIATRDKKVFLSDQYKEIEENNRRGRLEISSRKFSPEKAMATHSNVLAWRIPWTREPGGLPSMGSHRVRHD